MKRRIVTSFDQRFYLDPDDFYKQFAASKGMRKVVEILGYIKLFSLSPTGFSRQFSAENLMADTPLARDYFVEGHPNNAFLNNIMAHATMIVCEVKPIRHQTTAAVLLGLAALLAFWAWRWVAMQGPAETA